MSRLSFVIAMLAVAVNTACLASTPSGPRAQIPYAVIFGHIAAPKPTIQANANFFAYTDSAHALAGGDTAGYAGNFSQQVDDSNNYVAVIPAATPATYYLNMSASGQTAHGFETSVDTFRAVRVHFDTIGGGVPHDSIQINDSLP